MPNLTLVSHHLCPYVQRSVIALREKKVPFERIDIDLVNKPDWFNQLSPLGKTPVLKVDDTAIFESAVILEYLEDAYMPALHPEAPLRRAQHRAWIEFSSAILNNIAVFYNAMDQQSFVDATDALRQKFYRLDQELSPGDWFGGEGFSLVDAVFAPVFRYFDVFDQIGDFGILANLERVSGWRKRLAVRQSVVSAVGEDYPDRLLEFLRKRTSHLSRLIA